MGDGTDDTVDPAQEMLNEGAPPAPAAPAINYQQMFEAMQQQNAQLAAQNAQLAQTVQQVATRPIAPAAPQPDPYAAFNPETASAIKGVVESMNANFQQKLAQQEQRFAGMALEQEAASIIAIPGIDPAIAKRAQDIFRGNRAKGIPLTANEAADFAIGEAVRNGTFKGNVPANHQNRGTPPPTINGGSRPPMPAKAQPDNFDRLSRKEQIKFYESINGFDDTRIDGWNIGDD